jgi:HlyD family secretion protein
MVAGQVTRGARARAEASEPRFGPGLRVVAGVLALAATAGAVEVAWVWFATARRGPRNLVLPGVVEVQEVRLGSKVGGRVRAIHVLEGDVVAQDQPLVTFDMPEMEAQRLQWQAKLRSDLAALEKACNGPRREEIAAAAAQVAAAEARYTRIQQGFREEEIRQAKNDWLSAEADLRLAEENLGRYDRLHQRGSATQAELDSARADYDRARGRAAAAKARFDMMFKGNRPQDIAEAAALLDQARANLDLLKAGTRAEDIAALAAQAAQSRARLREVEANLAEAVVTAPGKAIVDIISVRKGDLVAPSQTVVRVLKADDLWVKVFIPETELGRVRRGQTVAVTIDSYPGERFPGRIVQIAAQSEFTPRNIQSADERRYQVFAAKVRVDDPRGVFKAGMAAEVTIPREGREFTAKMADRAQ